MSGKKKIKLIKLIITSLVLLVFIGLCIYLFPVMKDLSSLEGQRAFEEKVESSGMIGLLTLFGLQVAQIFLIIVPGEPIEILAGMCYGWFGRYDIYYDFSVYHINNNLFVSKKIWEKICL